MSCFRRCLLVAILFALVCLASIGVLAWSAAGLLNVPDTPVRSDAIVVLSGDALRAVHAADLYRQGLAPRVLLMVEARSRAQKKLDEIGVPFPRTETVYHDALVKLGVPAAAISIIGGEVPGTAAEAEAEALYAALPAGTRLLVVTSPYHLRRTRMIFTDRFPADQVRIVPTPYDPFPARWWTDQEAARNVLQELGQDRVLPPWRAFLAPLRGDQRVGALKRPAKASRSAPPARWMACRPAANSRVMSRNPWIMPLKHSYRTGTPAACRRSA